jgi:hypothetical protein
MQETDLLLEAHEPAVVDLNVAEREVDWLILSALAKRSAFGDHLALQRHIEARRLRMLQLAELQRHQ